MTYTKIMAFPVAGTLGTLQHNGRFIAPEKTKVLRWRLTFDPSTGQETDKRVFVGTDWKTL